MKFSTKTIQKMAEIMAKEMEASGVSGTKLREIEQEMREVLRTVGAEALGQILTNCDHHQVTEKTRPCTCGSRQVYQFRRKGVLLSVFGRVKYTRRYYTCPGCHQGQAPLDQLMGITPGEVTAGLAELLALTGIEMPFEEAKRFVERFLLFRVSENTVRKETERFGALQQTVEKQWKTSSQEEPWLQVRQHNLGKPSNRLYGSMDGVMVPLQGEWRELKNITWYQVEAVLPSQPQRRRANQVGQQDDLRAQHISYHCDIQGAEVFGELLWATGCQRQADICEELVFVCDGAQWIWKLIDHYFPQAVQIVDWYHASAYLAPIAEAAFGDDTAAYLAWLQQARTQLWQGQIDDLIHDCLILAAKPAAKQAVHVGVTYFTNNQHRMDYAHFRQQGYFVGSGTVESAGKQIAASRLKRSGARWTEQGAIQTAKARAVWLSGNWETLAVARATLPLAV